MEQVKFVGNYLKEKYIQNLKLKHPSKTKSN